VTQNRRRFLGSSLSIAALPLIPTAVRAADLPKIADFFALTIKPEGGLITHNLSTAVIGPDGKIVGLF